MLRKNVYHSSIYGLERTILIILYLITAISIYIVIGFLLYELLNAGVFVLILAFILYLVVAVIIGGFLHIISYIPSNLAGAFDPIKNDIAAGKINSLSLFSERLVKFMISFFDFAFFDIEHCIVKIKSEQPVTSFEEEISKLPVDWEEIIIVSKKIKGVEYIKRIDSNQGMFHFYILPVWFGEEWLGYIGIFTRGKIWKIFRELLSEFENNFIDDQLIHILK